MKLLIVDDEEFLVEMIQEILISENLILEENVFTANDGQLGWEIFQKEKPQIVITDIMMPKSKGTELIENIHQLDLGVEIIVITGFADLDLALSIIPMGVHDLLKKPFKHHELILTFTKAIKTIELKKQNKEFNEKLTQAEKLSSLGLLSAGIAHEINNPNTFIKGNLELLKKYGEVILPHLKNIPEDHEDFKKIQMIIDTFQSTLDAALKGSDRIRKIVYGLLSSSREQPTLKHKVHIQKIIDEASALAHHRIKNHDFLINIPENFPDMFVNEQEILLTLMNLFVNAIDAIEDKHKPPQKGLLEVTVTSDKEHQIIQVKDNGIGMSEETKSKIFDPFFTTKKIGKGTGLGLTASIGNIQRNGGTIELETALNQGSTFTIKLPNNAD